MDYRIQWFTAFSQDTWMLAFLKTSTSFKRNGKLFNHVNSIDIGELNEHNYGHSWDDNALGAGGAGGGGGGGEAGYWGWWLLFEGGICEEVQRGAWGCEHWNCSSASNVDFNRGSQS